MCANSCTLISSHVRVERRIAEIEIGREKEQEGKAGVRAAETTIAHGRRHRRRRCRHCRRRRDARRRQTLGFRLMDHFSSLDSRLDAHLPQSSARYDPYDDDHLPAPSKLPSSARAFPPPFLLSLFIPLFPFLFDGECTSPPGSLSPDFECIHPAAFSSRIPCIRDVLREELRVRDSANQFRELFAGSGKGWNLEMLDGRTLDPYISFATIVVCKVAQDRKSECKSQTSLLL